MRPLISDFITWLSSSDYDEEAAYGEEEEPVEEAEEEKKEELIETEAQRNQRLMIEAQKKA